MVGSGASLISIGSLGLFVGQDRGSGSGMVLCSANVSNKHTDRAFVVYGKFGGQVGAFRTRQ